MQGLLIQTKDKDEERCLRRIERSIQNDAPLPVDAHHYRTRELLTRLRALPETDRTRVCALANEYDTLLRETGQLDIEFSNHPERRVHVGTILGLPFFLYGLLNHALWLLVITAGWRALGIERNYKATVQMLGSWFILPVIYLLQTLVFNWVWPAGWGWLYLLSLPVSGLFALKYWVMYRAFWAGRFSGARSRDARLGELRGELLAAFGG